MCEASELLLEFCATVRTEAFVAVQQVETLDTEAVARCGGDLFEEVHRSLVFNTRSVAISIAWQRDAHWTVPASSTSATLPAMSSFPYRLNPSKGVDSMDWFRARFRLRSRS